MCNGVASNGLIREMLMITIIIMSILMISKDLFTNYFNITTIYIYNTSCAPLSSRPFDNSAPPPQPPPPHRSPYAPQHGQSLQWPPPANCTRSALLFRSYLPRFYFSASWCSLRVSNDIARCMQQGVSRPSSLDPSHSTCTCDV